MSTTTSVKNNKPAKAKINKRPGKATGRVQVKTTAKAKNPAVQILDEKELRAEERRLRTAYPRIVVGSIRNCGQDPGLEPKWALKRTVEIRCAYPGCKEIRRIATSDLHQVTMCVDHTELLRRERRNERRRVVKK